MAKENGLGASIAIDDSGGTARTVTNDIRDCNISTPRAMLDITGMDKSAIERLQTHADGSVDANGVFNDTVSTGLFTVLKTIPSTSVIRTMTFGLSGQSLAMEMIANDMKLSRGTDGGANISTHLDLADGAVPTWA